jgi:hypothetical protein
VDQNKEEERVSLNALLDPWHEDPDAVLLPAGMELHFLGKEKEGVSIEARNLWGINNYRRDVALSNIYFDGTCNVQIDGAADFQMNFYYNRLHHKKIEATKWYIPVYNWSTRKFYPLSPFVLRSYETLRSRIEELDTLLLDLAEKTFSLIESLGWKLAEKGERDPQNRYSETYYLFSQKVALDQVLPFLRSDQTEKTENAWGVFAMTASPTFGLYVAVSSESLTEEKLGEMTPLQVLAFFGSILTDFPEKEEMISLLKLQNEEVRLKAEHTVLKDILAVTETRRTQIHLARRLQEPFASFRDLETGSENGIIGMPHSIVSSHLTRHHQGHRFGSTSPREWDRLRFSIEEINSDIPDSSLNARNRIALMTTKGLILARKLIAHHCKQAKKKSPKDVD